MPKQKEQPYETIDRIHRAIWLGLYPEQLCRYLSFVVKKDTGDTLIRDFLNWSLTQGDFCVKKTGYCELTHVEKRLAFEALKMYR